MKRILSLVLGLVLSLPGAIHGADGVGSFPPAADESARFQAEIILDGLDHPCGLTKRPRVEKNVPQEILFAESGTGRVVSFDPTSPWEVRDVLTGLKAGKVADLDVQAGVWSLGFVTPTKLAVYGGMKDGGDRVGVYLLTGEASSLTADKQDHEVVINKGESSESQPILSSMIFGDTMAYFTDGALTPPGQVLRAGLAANRIEMPQPQLNTSEAIEAHWPTGICLSPSGKMQFVVTSFAGGLTKTRDSRVVFLIPTSGKKVLDLVPGLFDVVGLAYSPSGQLYAIDLAWEDERGGGVYRLDDARFEGQPACRAVKIAAAVRPTSLLFSDGGALYVTAWGKGSDVKQGTVTKITGEF